MNQNLVIVNAGVWISKSPMPSCKKTIEIKYLHHKDQPGILISVWFYCLSEQYS